MFFTVVQTWQTKHLWVFYDHWRLPLVLSLVWKGGVRWGAFSSNMQLHYWISLNPTHWSFNSTCDYINVLTGCHKRLRNLWNATSCSSFLVRIMTHCIFPLPKSELDCPTSVEGRVTFSVQHLCTLRFCVVWIQASVVRLRGVACLPWWKPVPCVESRFNRVLGRNNTAERSDHRLSAGGVRDSCASPMVRVTHIHIPL